MEKYLPYLLLLLCPLMHFFMMRGHQHQAPHENTQNAKQQESDHKNQDVA